MNANKDTRIGRNRARRLNGCIGNTCALFTQFARDLYDMNGVLGRQRDEQHQADLRLYKLLA